MCGGCVTNHSFAFFSTSCVPSVQCSSWNWVPLIAICITFQFLFSILIINYSSETDLLQKQERMFSLSRFALEQVSLFQNLCPDDFDAVVSKMELVHIAASSTVLVQGQPTSFMYIIKSGVLNVFLHDGQGKEILLDSLGAPNVIGEQSLINGIACGASVRAIVDSDLWRLDRSCLDNVSEDDRRSFARAKQAKYARPAFEKESHRFRDEHADLWRPLSVLMWFYQLAGIMLSVSSPLSYLDGSAASFSVVSFLVNAKPSNQAASDVSTESASSLGAINTGSFQFCVSSSISYSQMYFATLLNYVAWGFLMAFLAQQRVWKLLRRMIICCILGAAWILEVMSGWLMPSSQNGFAIELRRRLLHRRRIDIDIRGPVIMKWFVTCFSALASLMMQGTACVRLEGLFDAADDLRWIYDGRVACFSDSGELPGRWQIASAIGVVVVLIAPALLWRIMLGIQRLDERLRSPLKQSALEAYSGPYFSHARHWMVVM
jgi:hypothetical protein